MFLLFHSSSLVTFVLDGVLSTFDVKLEEVFFVLALCPHLLLLLSSILCRHLLLLLQQSELPIPLSSLLMFLDIIKLGIESFRFFNSLLLQLLLLFLLALQGFDFSLLCGFFQSLNILLLLKPILLNFSLHV